MVKTQKNVLNNELVVGTWRVTHEDNPETGEEDLVEVYDGQVAIQKTEVQKYLGFYLSSLGNNMVNINQIKTKSKGIIRRIFSKLNSLNLQKYYIECALIFLRVMLRSSILYACETYYDLKETEIRQLEIIEESFLKELLKTGKWCSTSQLYSEVGLYPAKYGIIKLRLLFLKYILGQKEDSMIYQFFQLQTIQPIKGDWASTCIKSSNHLGIKEYLKK